MSVICTHSSQSAQTHPALASSEGLKAHHAHSSAAVSGEEEEKEEEAQREYAMFECMEEN